MDVDLLKFSNNTPNSASMADSVTFLIMLKSTCTGSFYGVIDCIGVLYFGPRKKHPLLCFVPLVMRFRIHPNRCE